MKAIFKYMYVVKKWLADIMPDRKDILYHWILIIYIAEIIQFRDMDIIWHLLAIMVTAGLIEVLDHISGRGDAQWSDFIATTLGGWSIIGLHKIGILINNL